jgi:ABC-type nitrate/sulfonate/bicarbonate transport system permease component
LRVDGLFFFALCTELALGLRENTKKTLTIKTQRKMIVLGFVIGYLTGIIMALIICHNEKMKQ